MTLHPPSRAGIRRIRDDAPTRFARRPGHEMLIGAAGVLLVGVCMALVRNGDVGDAERAVFSAINGLPEWLKPPMWAFQVFGTMATVIVAAGLAVALRRFRLGLALAAAVPAKLALEWWVVKALVERERPMFTVADAIVRDTTTARLGFPSGHAVFAFAVAGLVAPYAGRRGAIALYGLAVANGVARVYLGAHNPLDIVAGAGLGVAIAAFLNVVIGTPNPGGETTLGHAGPDGER